MNKKILELGRLLNAPSAWSQSLCNLDSDNIQDTIRFMLSHWHARELADGIRTVIDSGALSRFSFLFSSKDGKHFILELVKYFERDLQRELHLHIATSESLYIPYDLRSGAFAALKCDISAGLNEVSEKVAAAAALIPQVNYKDLSLGTSNGIDHTFTIPEERSARNKILLDASRVAMHRARNRLARRALGHPSSDPATSAPFAPSHIYIPENVIDVFQQAVKTSEFDWRDFIVDWNEVLTITHDEQYTTAEILRLLLLDNDYQLPGNTQRSIADAVYLNVLKTFSGAVIGLRGGVFFVEHGYRPESSFFLMCENSIIGKGCIIDATGAIIIEADAFLGGGFSPLLIHTHKHMNTGGANERKSVVPIGFRARSASRLPMDSVGVLEVFDLKPERWPGIERFDVIIRQRSEIWES